MEKVTLQESIRRRIEGQRNTIADLRTALSKEEGILLGLQAALELVKACEAGK